MIRWITDYLGGSRVPEPDELILWKDEGVDTVINLLKGDYGDFIAQKQKEIGFEVIRIPFDMYQIIPEEDFLAVYHYIDEIKNNKKIVVHCKYGQARSGTFLAGYLIHSGIPYEKAINKVMEKGFNPHTFHQINFLKNLSEGRYG
ncbi:dual specificity protein phosphatase [Persephonella sp.]|uniref:protein-tyrosine phosphatase family protein n=1 Tax=Persephonella sp. TaxID=2060922 RepID=UPI002600C774|nr:dual specificity protein phosphatase [Persephonella sp.]